MSVLVDTSTWIAYFRGKEVLPEVDLLIEENLLVTNDLILAELIPYLQIKKERRLIGLMKEIANPPLRINWPDLIQMQGSCLRNGINGVGIPDLIIAQQAIQNRFQLFTLDTHFVLMSKIIPLILYER